MYDRPGQQYQRETDPQRQTKHQRITPGRDIDRDHQPGDHRREQEVFDQLEERNPARLPVVHGSTHGRSCAARRDELTAEGGVVPERCHETREGSQSDGPGV